MVFGVSTMPKQKKPKRGSGQVVQGEILPTMEIDCTAWIEGTDIEEWTRGPLRPATGQEVPTQKRKRQPRRRSKPSEP
jgi:hypothetical protein